MFCKKCGSNLGDATSGFCPNCGEAVTTAQSAPQVATVSYQYVVKPPKVNPVEEFNLFSAFGSMFKKYAQFDGRSRRSEFWLATLCNQVINWIFLATLWGMYSSIWFGIKDTLTSATLIIALTSIIYAFATFIPSLSLTVRRLHDTGKSGWTYLITLIPFIGYIVLLVFLATDSEPGTNQYGTNPKGK